MSPRISGSSAYRGGMARVAGRNPVTAWIVTVLSLALLAGIVVVSLPIWPDLFAMLGDWWESVAPFRGS